MSKLHISPDLALPPDFVTSTTIVYGGKGMGKTNFGSVAVEEATKAGLRWTTLDPIGVWWGLRHSRDGRGPGISCVVLGGVHGDIPIEPSSGEIVADLVIDENVNTIVDFSRKPSGEMWSKADKIRFVTEYANRLFGRQGQLIDGRRREPILQFLDESARYIPQTIPAKSFQLAECVGAWEQIAEEGRNIGLGVCFLTQRSARMNKSVSELADVMFAFRTIGPNSLAAIMDWLGEHVDKNHVRELASQVRELPIGSALVVSPGWLKVEKVVRIRERETFDSSATPKPGQQGRRVTGKAAKPDLEKYRTRMAETIETVKANDPAELRKKLNDAARRIVELERAKPAAGSGKPAGVDPAVIERQVNAAVSAERRRIAREVTKVHASLMTTVKGLYGFSDTVGKLAQFIGELETPNATQPVASAAARTNSTTTGDQRVASTGGGIVRRAALEPRRSTSSDSDLAKGEKSTLIAIAQYDGAARDQLTVLTGYKRSTRDAYIQRLDGKGYVEIKGGLIYPTQAGVDALGSDYEPLPEGDDLRQYWLRRLPEGERRILEPCLEAYPDPVRRESLEESTGYKRSTRDAYIQRLTSRRLIEDAGRGEIRASSTLFGGTR